MTTFGLAMAGMLIIMGLRMISVALRGAFSNKVLVRQGLRYNWQSVEPGQAWQKAAQDGIMGILFIVLAVFMMI